MCRCISGHEGFKQGNVHSACLCGCDYPIGCGPRVITKKQPIDALEQHLESLREAAKGIAEHLAQVNKET